MTTPMRVLVTGHRGYIGSVMSPYLVRCGHEVVGLDTGYFDECTLYEPAEAAEIPYVRKDIRDLLPEDLRGFDAVVHLAALSNDPIGNLNDGWTEDINDRATARLGELAREAGVRRFLFSSSCIMYGMLEADVVDETAPLDPRTSYARSKVRSEAALRELADDAFSPVYLRNGTVYGASPRMRFDTVLNDFVASAFTTRKVTVMSDGRPWRPVVHVEDIARSFEMVLRAPLDVVHDEAFNNGTESLNHRVIELAEYAVAAVPGATLEVLGTPGADQRTYRADFSKFARCFPEFRFTWTPASGAHELAEAFSSVGLTHDQYVDARFTRLKWLDHLLRTGRLDGDLRWDTTIGASR
jgi:nucleoside-diphosphate-sugar epimerase